jgi:hypothetical protein
LTHLANFYINDLISNQKANLVRAIGPLRSVVNISSALFSLVNAPYRGFSSDKGFVRGLSEGLQDFFLTISDEANKVSAISH